MRKGSGGATAFSTSYESTEAHMMWTENLEEIEWN